ncbi:MAG: RDD family protein [Acidobacteriota bacterium]|nr:RDD family protein [Acidobacteriota bacterium]
MRSTPSRISPATYPIAATATAAAYDFEPERAPIQTASAPEQANNSRIQQALFTTPLPESRVIPFDSLTSPAERNAIRLRAGETQRPVPVQTTKVEARRSKPRRGATVEQQELEFQGEEQSSAPASVQLLCETPAAPVSVRLQAALFDTLIMGCGCGIGLAMFFYVGGQFTGGKQVLPFFAAALLTVPLFYKLLWAFAGQDSPGTKISGLELVDFDGRRPSRLRRYQRLFGSALSLLAAGVGMIWILVDEDKLTWHDHISGTFPTLSSET